MFILNGFLININEKVDNVFKIKFKVGFFHKKLVIKLKYFLSIKVLYVTLIDNTY